MRKKKEALCLRGITEHFPPWSGQGPEPLLPNRRTRQFCGILGLFQSLLPLKTLNIPKKSRGKRRRCVSFLILTWHHNHMLVKISSWKKSQEYSSHIIWPNEHTGRWNIRIDIYITSPRSFRARGLRNGAHDMRIPTHSTRVALLRFHKAKAYSNLRNPHSCSGELESPFSTQQKTRATESGSHCMAN